MDFWQILMTPFSWLLLTFYEVLGNYGLALVLFCLVTKVILYPLSLKGKRSMIKMNAINPEMQALQRKYGSDQNRYALEVQKLQQREGVSPYGGCLWSLLPMPILIGLFTIVRSPITYLMGLSKEAFELIKAGFITAGLVAEKALYPEIAVAKLIGIPEHMALAQNTLAQDATFAGFADKLIAIEFNVFGIDLSAIPTWKFWEGGLQWATIGLALLPVISAVLSFLSMQVSTKTNQMNQDQENPAANSLMMKLMSPVMSLWFGYSMPAGVAVYWIANSFFTMLQELLMARVLRKEYAEANERRIEAQAREKEEEKRRKAEQAEERARRIEEEKRNKAKKKEKPAPVGDREASREGLRAYARGRAYDPNRYGGVTPYGGGAPVPKAKAETQILTDDSAADLDVLTEGEVRNDEMD